MRKVILAGLVATAALGLSACSEQTQDAAAETADSMGEDMEAAGDAVADTAEGAVDATAEAADEAVAATDEMGDKVADEAAKVEAEAHNESVAEAKAD